MTRLFPVSSKRNIQSLDGFWEFEANGYTKNMYVPSCWNVTLGLLTYRGTATYQKTFTFEGGNLWLSFGGVLSKADVYLDGVYWGSHDGGYTAFTLEKEHVLPGKHTLTVTVNNQANHETIPSSHMDWFFYGGIFRRVEYASLPPVHFVDHKFSYTLSDDLSLASLHVHGKLSQDANVPFAVYLEGKKVFEGTSQQGDCVAQFSLEHPRLWDIGKGELYTLSIETDEDDVVERIGFRSIRIQNRKVLLNNREIFLKGINRHEDHPDFGHAVPAGLMQRDIDIVLDLGCNTIRGSHYPNSRLFMDMLDEQGILFWCEIPMWGVKKTPLITDALYQRGVAFHREMVHQYYHHPSIILWGLHNEIDAQSQQARELTQGFRAEIEAYDTSRLITFATDHPAECTYLDLCDIICMNLYFGWYGGDMRAWPGFIKDFRQKMKDEGLEDKPIMISEFGAAGLYGHHTFDNIKWTEEYQANLVAEELNTFFGEEEIVGTYVWHFADARTSIQATDRARGFNNKGMLNEYRKPKAAYFSVKNAYRNQS